MPLNKTLLNDANLYVILDTSVCSYDELYTIVEQTLPLGVTVYQLRDKGGNAKDILAFSKKATALVKDKALYIINDRVDLTILSNADGVHLGQDDIDIESARKMLGDDYLIGKSCQTFKHVSQAQIEGANYIGFGSVFKTKTKPERLPMDLDLLKRVSDYSDVPLFAIGGITADRVEELKHCHVNRIAVCRAILESENISKTVNDFQAVLT